MARARAAILDHEAPLRIQTTQDKIRQKEPGSFEDFLKGRGQTHLALTTSGHLLE